MLMKEKYLEHYKSWITFLILALFINACGFKLRTSFDLPQELHTLNVIGDEPGFKSNVIKTLKAASINVSEDAPVTLKLLNLELHRRVAAVDSNAKPSEYALKYQLDYQLIDVNNDPISSKQKVNVTRSYAFTPEDISAKHEEEGLLMSEMRNDIVIKLIRQLRNISINFPESNTEDAPATNTPQGIHYLQ